MANVPVRPDLPVPSNTPQPNEERKQIQKVTKGKVVEKKQSLSKKFMDTFIAEDLENVKEFIIFDVIVPAMKDTFLSSLNMLLWGSPNYRRTGGYSNVVSRNNERNSYWTYGNESRTERRDRGRSNPRRGQADVRNLLFETRVDAEEVVGALEDALERYGRASVADLYDAAGITSEHTDYNWGWVRGDEFRIRPVQGGYMIDLPRFKVLN